MMIHPGCPDPPPPAPFIGAPLFAFTSSYLLFISVKKNSSVFLSLKVIVEQSEHILNLCNTEVKYFLFWTIITSGKTDRK